MRTKQSRRETGKGDDGMKKEMKETRYVIAYSQSPSGMFGVFPVTYQRVYEAAEEIRKMVKAQHRADLVGNDSGIDYTEAEVEKSWEDVCRHDAGLWTETIKRRGTCEICLHGTVYLYKIEPVMV